MASATNTARRLEKGKNRQDKELEPCYGSAGNGMKISTMHTPGEESTQELNERKLLLAQLFIQNNLDANLSLTNVARMVGSSPSHFHRLFKSRIGESLKSYIDRMRAEKSVYDLRISNLNLMQIALRYGFKNPETYSRVFKRRFGQVPSTYARGRRIPAPDPGRGNTDKPNLELGLRQSGDSNFAVTRLNRLGLAFARHVGPYAEVPAVGDIGPTLWRSLEAFVEDNQIVAGAPVYLGIPQDSPVTTEPHRQRFDLCLLVDTSFTPRGKIGYQEIPEGYYGVLTHAGPYGSLIDSFRELFERARSLNGFEVVPSDVFELYVDPEVTTSDERTWTELYMRLEPLGRERPKTGQKMRQERDREV